MPFVKSDHIWAQAQIHQSVERKFKEYRTAIKDAHQVDIKNYKDRMKGGFADGKAVIDYNLKELLEGVKWERVHTRDNLLALDLAMDHLERIPDYYSRLAEVERECVSDKLLGM
jgi:ribosome-associated translation inhibitor RaiA